MDIRPVFFINGLSLLVLAVVMCIPALVDGLDGGGTWKVFLASSAATAFLGGALTLAARPIATVRLDTRQLFLVTAAGWASAAVCAAFPFAFATPGLAPTDALFEAMSGLTTTGATVMSGLDGASKGILVWRALLNWIGGAGIIVMAVTVLPAMRIGGMDQFRKEVADNARTILPQVSQSILALMGAYASLTVLSALAFGLAGMDTFDALCHAMSALSTGGFSTSDQSLARWGVGVQWVAVFSMLVGAAPLSLFVSRRAATLIRNDDQLAGYLLLLAGFICLMALWRWGSSDLGPSEALQQSVFAVTSIVSTTGFIAADYSTWGGFAQVVFFLLAFVGGCTGSTAGAIKVFRWQMLVQLADIHIQRLLHPHGVFVIYFNRRRVEETVLKSVLAFVVLYIVVFAIHALALTLAGLDLVSALSASVAALGNVGRGLGDVIGPGRSWAALSDPAKWILAFEMLIGRLEVFTVLMLFTPGFWRR